MVVAIQYCVGNQLIDWDFLEHVDLENVQQELWRCRKVQSPARDDDDEIDADGDPDLRLDGVEGVAKEMLDRQVLLDPLEEGLDLPALAINLGDGTREDTARSSSPTDISAKTAAGSKASPLKRWCRRPRQRPATPISRSTNAPSVASVDHYLCV